MRILCLHGQGASADIFERQLGPLLSLLPNTWSCDYVDSSHACSAAAELNGVYPGPYYCFFPRFTPEAMEEAVHFVQEVLDEDGPYDCVIGFSQGASVAAAYMAHCEKDPTVLDLSFRMAVFICAALIPPELAAKSELSKSIQSFGDISVPTVSIIGQRDLCYNQSVALSTTCKNTMSQAVYFDGGHHIPKDSGNLKRLALVLERMSRISHVRN